MRRGWFVYNTLTQHASRTQAGLRADLEAKGVSSQSFWAANMIVATADRALIESVAARGDVARIDSNNAVHWIEPPELANPTANGNDPAAPNTAEWGVQNVNAQRVGMGFTGQGMVVGETRHRDTLEAQRAQAEVSRMNGVAPIIILTGTMRSIPGGGVCGPDTVEPCDDTGHGTHTAGTTVAMMAPGIRSVSRPGRNGSGAGIWTRAMERRRVIPNASSS